MTSKDILALMECKRKYMIRDLSLKGQDERGICFQKALRICARGIAKGKKSEMLLSEIQTYLESAYLEEWFLFGWQKKKVIQKDMALFERFLESSYLKELVTDRKSTFQDGYPLNVPISLCCNEIAVTQISGRADLLIRHGNGNITGIVLCRKFARPYSFRARKEENKVMGSVELLVLLKGLREAFPEGRIRVMMIRLVSPSDTNSCLAAFEKKKGDHVICFTEEDFLAAHPEGVEARIQMIVQNVEPGKCQDCCFEEMCRSANKIYVKTQEKEPAVKKSFVFLMCRERLLSMEQVQSACVLAREVEKQRFLWNA